jgi:GT2 family glycosyltransferase
MSAGGVVRGRVGVVLLQWNGHALTRRCLESFRAQTRSDVRVYVADNGSTDAPAESLAREFADLQLEVLCHGSNLGFAAGNNPAIRRALEHECEFVLLLNNDVVCIAPDFLGRGVEAMAASDVGIVGGKLVRWPDTSRLWSVGGEIGWVRERFLGLDEPDCGQYDAPADRGFVSGAMMLVRHRVFERIGLLPEAYFFGGEDREFSLRARRAGFRLRYEPRFLAAHEAEASHAAARPEYVYNDAMARILFRKRNQPPWSHAVWRAAYGLHVRWLLPARHALRRGEFVDGLGVAELQRILRHALEDSRGLERTTADTIRGYRERLEPEARAAHAGRAGISR